MGIVLTKLDSFPEFGRHVGPLGGLHVEIETAIAFANGGVFAVGEGTGLAVAESGDVEFVAAEGLFLGSSGWGGWLVLRDIVMDG